MADGTDMIDDISVSNNNDRNKVLATVANTIFDFTSNNGNHYIFATLGEISMDFDVYGYKDHGSRLKSMSIMMRFWLSGDKYIFFDIKDNYAGR